MGRRSVPPARNGRHGDLVFHLGKSWSDHDSRSDRASLRRHRGACLSLARLASRHGRGRTHLHDNAVYPQRGASAVASQDDGERNGLLHDPPPAAPARLLRLVRWAEKAGERQLEEEEAGLSVYAIGLAVLHLQRLRQEENLPSGMVRVSMPSLIGSDTLQHSRLQHSRSRLFETWPLPPLGWSGSAGPKASLFTSPPKPCPKICSCSGHPSEELDRRRLPSVVHSLGGGLVVMSKPGQGTGIAASPKVVRWP